MNDTHPTVAVAELMRILLDEEGLEWDEAWEVTTKTVAYTNHTIMAEALEKWPIELFSRLLPRVYQIVEEINRRFVDAIQRKYPGNQEKVRKMAIIYDGQVKMAHLAIAAGYSVNGVARLHTEILKNQLGFDGLIVTDSLRMGAIHGVYQPGEAALLALEAGCHVLLMPSSLSAAFDAVVAAVEEGSFPLEKLDSIVCKVLEFKLSHGIL
jgi:hypothetical protein